MPTVLLDLMLSTMTPTTIGSSCKSCARTAGRRDPARPRGKSGTSVRFAGLPEFRKKPHRFHYYYCYSSSPRALCSGDTPSRPRGTRRGWFLPFAQEWNASGPPGSHLRRSRLFCGSFASFFSVCQKVFRCRCPRPHRCQCLRLRIRCYHHRRKALPLCVVSFFLGSDCCCYLWLRRAVSSRTQDCFRSVFRLLRDLLHWSPRQLRSTTKSGWLLPS